MALGRQNNVQGELIVLNLKTTDENRVPIEPKFDVLRKSNETGKFEKTGVETSFSGRLKSVQTKVSEFKKDGKVIDSKEKVDLYVADGEETYLLSLNYNIASRGLFNRLFSLESFDDIEINVWQDEKKYTVLTLRQNNKSIKGKYKKEDFPEAEVITNKKGEVLKREYGEVDAFFKEKLVELGERVKGHTPAKKAEPAGVTGQASAALGDDDDQQIPF